MDDDTAPRMTPPPKPTVLQLSTPKPEVSEVSLMFDSNDSLIWQASKPRNLKEKEQSFRCYVKQDKMQISSQSRVAISAQTPVTRDMMSATGMEDYNRSTLRRPQVASNPYVFFPRGEKQSTDDVTSEIRATERKFQDLQMNKPFDVIDPPFTYTGNTGCVNERLYNPKVYSPAQEMVTNKASTNDGLHCMKQKDSTLTNCVTFGAQQHPTRTEKFIFPQVKPTRPYIFNSEPATPPVMKRVMFSQDNISTSVEPESDGANKTNAFHLNSCLPQNQDKKENHPSFAAHQLQTPMDSRAYFSENVDNRYFSPPPISHPSQASQSNHTLQDQRYNGLVKQGGAYIEPFSYSPDTFNGRVYSSPDPMVYRLIEDQNLQILKLSKTIERIIENQQEDKPPKDVSLRELANNKVIHSVEGNKDQDKLHKNISTQTLTTSMPEKRCIGVNTDLSWPDLIASIRNCDTCGVHDHRGSNSVERSKVTEDIKLNYMKRNSPRENIEPDKCHGKQKLSLNRNSPFQEIMSESPGEEGASTTQEGVMSATLEEQPRSHPLLPIGIPQYYGSKAQEKLAGHLRNDSKRTVELGSSLALGESASTCRDNAQNQKQPTNPTSPPPGVAFYNDVLTNIHQILQSSKTSQEERDYKQSDKEEKQSSKHVEASTEKIIPDPQIEAVKKQLLQFGISFIDPASLTSDHSTMLDTIYLPGVHNMLSLYQSTVSTHYQTPYQEIDATAAKYLTDSQLAAIAAMSPAMSKRNRGTGALISHDYPILAEDINRQERMTQSQLYQFTMNNNFSIATKKFLNRYGLQDD